MLDDSGSTVGSNDHRILRSGLRDADDRKTVASHALRAQGVCHQDVVIRARLKQLKPARGDPVLSPTGIAAIDKRSVKIKGDIILVKPGREG